MRAAVGGEYRRATSFPVSRSDIRRWAIAIYYPDPPPPLYWDEEHARKTRWGSIIAPEEFNPFAWMRAAPLNDEEAGAFLPEPSLGLRPGKLRVTVISNVAITHAGPPMRPGDVIRMSTLLAEYGERQGRAGLMLVTTGEERWFNQRDELVRTTMTTFVRYR